MCSERLLIRLYGSFIYCCCFRFWFWSHSHAFITSSSLYEYVITNARLNSYKQKVAKPKTSFRSSNYQSYRSSSRPFSRLSIVIQYLASTIATDKTVYSLFCCCRCLLFAFFFSFFFSHFNSWKWCHCTHIIASTEKKHIHTDIYNHYQTDAFRNVNTQNKKDQNGWDRM